MNNDLQKGDLKLHHQNYPQSSLLNQEETTAGVIPEVVEQLKEKVPIHLSDDSSTDSEYDFVLTDGQTFVSHKFDEYISDNLEILESKVVVEEVPGVLVETEDFPFRRKDFCTKKNPNIIEMMNAEEEYQHCKEVRRKSRYVNKNFRESARERLNATLRRSEISAFSRLHDRIVMVSTNLHLYEWKTIDEPDKIIHFLFYYCPKIGYYFVDIDRTSDLASKYGSFLIGLSHGRLKSDFKSVDKPLPMSFQLSMLRCFDLPVFKWVIKGQYGDYNHKRYVVSTMKAQGGDGSDDSDVTKLLVQKAHEEDEDDYPDMSIFNIFTSPLYDGNETPESYGSLSLEQTSTEIPTLVTRPPRKDLFELSADNRFSLPDRLYSDSTSTSLPDDFSSFPWGYYFKHSIKSFLSSFKEFIGVDEFSNDTYAMFKTSVYDFLRNFSEGLVKTICEVSNLALNVVKDIAKLFYSFVMVIFKVCKDLTNRGVGWIKRLLNIVDDKPSSEDDFVCICGEIIPEGEYSCVKCGTKNKSSSASASESSDDKGKSRDKGHSFSFKDKNAMYAQSADDFSWVPLVGDLLACLVAFIPAFNKHGYSPSTLKDYFKDYTHVHRGVHTMSENKMAERMTNYFVYGDAMQGPHNLEERAKKLRVELASLHEQCCGTLDVQKTVDLGQEIINKHQELIQIRLDLLGAGYNAAQMSAINLTINSLQTTVNAIKRLHRQRGVRPRPVVIFLHGDRGCGKTKMAERFGNDVLRYIKEHYPNSPYASIPKEQASFAFDATRNQEFFEGYSNQFCMRIEEIYSSIDDALNQNWSRNLFSWADNRPVELNTAFEDKGMVYFTSPLIVCTTNREDHVLAVVDSGAYYRRLDFDVEVTRQQKPNPCKYAIENKLEITDPKVAAYANIEPALFNKMTTTDKYESFRTKNAFLFDNELMKKDYTYKEMVIAAAQVVVGRSMEISRRDEDYEALFAQSIYALGKAVAKTGSLFTKYVFKGMKCTGDCFLTGSSILWYNLRYKRKVNAIVDDSNVLEFWKFYREYETDDEFLDFVELYFKITHDADVTPNGCAKDKKVMQRVINLLSFESKIVKYDDHEDYPSNLKVLFMCLTKSHLHKTKALVRNYAWRLSLLTAMSEEEAVNYIITDIKGQVSFMSVMLKYPETYVEKTNDSLDKLRDDVFELMQFAESRDKLKLFIGGAVFVAAIAAGYYMAKSLIVKFDPEYISQSDDGKQPKVETNPENKKIAAIVHSAQSSQNIRNLEDRIARQTWCVVTATTTIGHCIFLNNNTIAIPRHVWTAAEERFILYNPALPYGKKVVWYKSDLSIIFEPEDRDLYFVRVPVTTLMKKIKLLPKEETTRLSTVLGSSFYHYSIESDENGESVVQVKWTRAGQIKRPKVVQEVHGVSKNLLQDVYWVENNLNKPGYSGRPYIAEVANVSYCLMLHIAGSAHGSCYGVPLYAEDVEMANTNLPIFAQCMQAEFVPDEPVKEDDDWIFESLVHTKATNTTVFVPTNLVGPLGPPLKIPANLGEEAYQLAKNKAIPFHDCVVLHEDTYTLLNEKGVDFLNREADYLVNDYDLKECRFLTVEESLYGVPGQIDSFDFSTADGMILKHLKIKKKQIAERDSEQAKFLIDYIGKIWLGIMAGKFPYHTAAEALKDELRDLERVAAKKTRIFFVHDFVYNVLMKMALGDFVTKWKKRLGVHSHACGVTPGTSIWKKWYYMFNVNSFVVCGDVSGNDYMHSPAILETIIKYLLQFYPCTNGSIDNTNVIVWAIMGLIFALRFNKGKGDLQGHGNTSGNYLTTMINTLQLVLLKCSCFYIAAKKMTTDPDDALKKLTMIIYSDDNISQSPFEWWNIHTFAALARKYFGAIITATDKSDNLRSFPIDDADFLSRRFVPHELNPDIICSPLAYESLVSQLYFVRKAKGGQKDKGHIIRQLEQNLGNVKLELLHYKYDEATEIVKNINASLKESFYNLRIEWYPSRREHYAALVERYL